MRSLFCYLILMYMVPAIAKAKGYSHEDSVKAKKYFSESWKYGLMSDKHQMYLDSALMVMPTNAYYWQQKCMPLYKAFRHEVGRPYLDSAVKYDPENWLDYRGFMSAMFARAYSDALKDFHLAMSLYGNKPVMDHSYTFYIGLCHLQLGNLDSSEYYLKSCIADELKKYPDESWVHYNHLFYMAMVYYQRSEYGKSVEYLDKALKQYATFSDAQYYKSWCCYEMGKKDEALAWMEKAYTNFKEGYSLNEDNERYEYYPYQVRKYYLTSALEAMRKEMKTK
jgi:tetratricopeptide (TPR) repeat protein